MIAHLLIPDCQVKPGVPMEHLDWIGQFIMDERPDVIINIGDFADMESLSSYDRGKKSFEGRRYRADVEACIAGLERLHGPMMAYNEKQKSHRHAGYKPRMVITLGNHEHRINRAVENQPELEGVIHTDDLAYRRFGYEVYDFLVPVEIDGVFYAHFFHNKNSQTPHGNSRLMLQREHASCTQGHVQTLDYEVQPTRRGIPIHGLRCGSCYLHDEDYKGPQGNDHWRGIVLKKDVADGDYSPQFISLDALRRRYE